MTERTESAVRLVILLAIGTMAGAAAFTHVHDLSVAHGQPDWIGWANAVAVELMAIYLGLELRARRRAGRPVGLVSSLLVAFALLSLAAQVAEAEPSVWGWTVAAVPSLAFLALVKVVLSNAPAVPPAPEPDQPRATGTRCPSRPPPNPSPRLTLSHRLPSLPRRPCCLRVSSPRTGRTSSGSSDDGSEAG